MAGEVFWSAIFLTVFDCLLLGILKWGALVTWKRGEDPGRKSSVEGKGWLSEFVMQLSAWKEEVM
jgi:hypothetical protein